ncbi:MAG: MBOAT family O-acyltransferase, partial [Gemmatimonadota bacterium]
MLPNSLTFLAFFAAVAVVYYVLPHRFRWPLLLVASLYFYATFDPTYIFLLLGVTGIAWAGGLAVARTEGRARKASLAVSVVAVVGALLFFKYYAFLFDSFDALLQTTGAGGMATVFPRFPRLDLVLAVGLSFYTFSCVSYVADVYSGRLEAERHFGHFALYVSFFPKLLAGPIERARPFLEQIRTPVRFSGRGVALGLQVLLWGLVKKVVIADHLAVFVDATYGQAAFASPADLVIATYFFAFQLYCDFSGYSEMAIGAAKILGIDLMENFRRPYLSTSTPEFWSDRWHLSLATWFRDYMYIPMGGSRVPTLRKYGNVMAVFLVSGLWHGAAWTFVVWGGLNGLYHVLSVMTRKLRDGAASLLRIPGKVR